jgi:hypothetical protein
MRMIVAALVALSLPVSTAQAQERTVPRRAQQNWNSGLIEGRQSAITSLPNVTLAPDFYGPRAAEEHLFSRADNRRSSGVGG